MATPPARSDKPSGKTLRKSLSHVGGAVRFAGDESLRALMTHAMTPATPKGDDDAAARALTHGFHPWPGRLHPHTARVLIDAAPKGVIADPFMGAGTVPLEALLAGRAALGNDLNPIGAEVAWVRTRRFSEGARQALIGRAKALVKKAEALLASGGTPDAAFRGAVGNWFDAQALREVWAIARCLREGDPAWQGSPADPLTRVLAMALSSILVKASRQVSDSVAKLDRRTPAGADATPPGRVGHWLKKRAEELAGQLGELAAAVPREVPEPRLLTGDARTPPADLADGADGADGAGRFAAVISSPPYPGVYDYLTHHALRCAVLGLPTGEATAREIGSRRASERLGKDIAHARYVEDLAQVLAVWSAPLVANGFVALIIGDGQIGKSVVRVLPLVMAAAKAANLHHRATLSQARPTFGPPAMGRGHEPGDKAPPTKDEHLVWLVPVRAAPVVGAR